MGKWNKFPGDAFLKKKLNKSCILQWENVADRFLEYGDFVSSYFETNFKTHFQTNFKNYVETNFETQFETNFESYL